MPPLFNLTGQPAMSVPRGPKPSSDSLAWSCEARRKSVASSPTRAAKCTPIGKPSEFQYLLKDQLREQVLHPGHFVTPLIEGPKSAARTGPHSGRGL